MPDKTRSIGNLVSDNNLFVNPTTDNTGIGTTNPTSKLHVVGNGLFSGIVTASSFAGNFTGTATTSTNVIGGIGSLSSLTVSGVSTLGVTSVTNLTSQNINVSGVATATTFVGNLTGTATTAGIATYATSSGIATYATSSGISTSVIGGIGSITSLSVSGISTLGILQISSGIVTATTGIITYYGDASNLSNIRTSYRQNNTLVGSGTTLNFIGAGVSSVTLSNDVVTVNIPTTVRTVNTYTATLNQTTFNATYNLGFVDVYYNGSKLSQDQYTATDGLTIVLDSGAAAGDIVEIVGYATYRVPGTQIILTDSVSSTSGIVTSYTGIADQGSSQSASVWLIRRTVFDSAGSTTGTGSTTNVAWVNRYTSVYT